MRQASWNEVFAPRTAEPSVLAPSVPEEPQGWRRLLWWEDLLTFALLGVAFLAVVGSVDRARWVEDMPTLYPIAFLGLVMGALLARLRWPEGFIHLFALPVGAAAVLGQILAVVPGPHPVSRYQTLTTRMGDWFDAAFTGGISNDSLPFIVSVVALSWLAAYLSAWAVFRWQNAWLALVPGGVALLTNIGYLPGQFSFAFVLFLFGGALLATRLHLLRRAKEWRERETPYPSLLSLSVLHATFWLAFLLVGLAWLLPQANEVEALESVWRRATAPITERVEGMGRLFVSVRSPGNGLTHDLDGTLPFRGSIELPSTPLLDVTTERLDQPQYLRADVYEIYTPSGWKQLAPDTRSLREDEITNVDEGLLLREPFTIRAVPTDRLRERILTAGPPRRVDRPAEAQIGGDLSDVLRVEPQDGLGEDGAYHAVGSVSVAPEAVLRAAATAYPDWVRDRYLQVPDSLPERVRRLAQDLTRYESTPYDQAVAIESHLRSIPYDLDVPDTPAGRDAVDFFLFDARRGYFDYHASAMVVLLRSAGIPSRLVAGYVLVGPERGAETDRFQVTERNAFAWPEVYFPGLGWVEFNPTPNLPRVQRPGPEPEAATTDNDPVGFLEGVDLSEFGAPAFEEGGGGASQEAAPSASGGSAHWVLIGVTAGVAVLLVSVAGGARFVWRRGLAGLEPPARLWGQTVRLASWARVPPAPTQTPREYARSLRDQIPGLDDVDLLAEAYARHRFGRGRWDEAQRGRLERAWRAVRGALVRRIVRLR